MQTSQFPFSSLPEIIQDAVRYSSSRYSLGQHPYALAALTIIGGTLGRSFSTVERHIGKKTYPNLLSIVVGGTGSGKGAIDRLLDPVFEYQCEWAKRRGTEISKAQSKLRILRSQRTALERTMKTSADVDASSDLADILSEIAGLEKLARAKPKLLVDQATSAGLCKILRGYDDSVLFSSLDGVDTLVEAAFGRDSLLKKLVLSGFANEFVDRTTASPLDYAGKPCLSGLYATQAYELEKLLLSEPRKSKALKVGFLNRMLVAESHLHLTGHRKTAEGNLSTWDRLISDLLKSRENDPILTYTWSDEASEAMDEALELSQKTPEYTAFASRELAGRDRELIAKLATIFLRSSYSYAELSSPRAIADVYIAKAAGKVWQYLSRHRLRVFCAPRLAELEKLRDSLTQFLEEEPDHEVYTSKLNGTIRRVRPNDLDDMLRICPGRLYIREGRIGTATRGPEGEILSLRPSGIENVEL